MANIGPRAHPESIDVRIFLQNVTNIVQTHFPVPDPKWLFNSKSYSFPRISEFKKAKTFSLYQPQTSISSHLPSVRNCQYLLRLPSNSKMTCCAINLRGRGYAINFQTPRFMIPVGISWHLPHQILQTVHRHLPSSPGVVVLKAWGLEKTCNRRRIKQLLLTTMILISIF